MSDPIEEFPAPELPPAFAEYEVPGVGTVIAPEGEPGYRVRLPSGAVTAFPALSGEPCEANAAADIAHAMANPPAAPVPSTVTRRQLFLWLNAQGITRAALRTQLAGNEAALIELEEATEFQRSHPLVAQLGATLGLTSAQIDDAFRGAAAL
jgi:hypothetical protein